MGFWNYTATIRLAAQVFSVTAHIGRNVLKPAGEGPFIIGAFRLLVRIRRLTSSAPALFRLLMHE
jgi:hypothetical protein